MPHPLTKTLQLLIALALPLVLLIGNTQLLMHMRFVNYEYDKASFPDDSQVPPGGYPLSKTERTALAEAALQSIAGPQGMRALETARFEETGELAFNAREIRHMEDVRQVFHAARTVFWAALVTLVASGLSLIRQTGDRRAVTRPLFFSVTGTLSLAVALGLYILVSFDRFFTQFHHVFFEGDTWLFRQDDTLIRLFPTPFWFDATTIIAALTAVELVLVGVVVWWWGKRDANGV